MTGGTVEFAGAIGRPGQPVPGALPQVAVGGRSNVGKSRLINALVGRKALARVSGTPGRTREINFFRVGDRFLLADLPGYGYARAGRTERQAWRQLVEWYLRESGTLAGVVVLIDCRRGVMEADREFIDLLAELKVPVLYVLTKIDKLNRSGRLAAERSLREALQAPEDQVLSTSARTREGVDDLTAALYALIDSAQEEAP